MNSQLKKEVYNYIDENGIPGSYQRSIVFHIGMAVELNIGVPTDRHRRFVPSLPFNLNTEEQEDVIRQYFFDLTGIQLNLIDDLKNYKSSNNKPFVLEVMQNYGSEVRFCISFKKIKGSISLGSADNILSLGYIEEIEGSLGFSDSTIEDLGMLMTIGGDFWIAQEGISNYTHLETLTPLLSVKGNMNLKNSPIKSLGTLTKVGGNLNLRKTSLKDLGNLQIVGGNLLLSKNLEQLDFTNIEVKGKIRWYKDLMQ